MAEGSFVRSVFSLELFLVPSSSALEPASVQESFPFCSKANKNFHP